MGRICVGVRTRRVHLTDGVFKFFPVPGNYVHTSFLCVYLPINKSSDEAHQPGISSGCTR